MIDETLLTYLALKYVPRKSTHVATAMRHWQYIKENMQQPRNPLKRLFFRWVELRVDAYFREYQALHRFNVVHTGPLVTLEHRVEVVFSNVEYHLVRPERD